MTYLLSETGLAVLRSFIDPSVLFAFDLDGTLAPIVDDRHRIHVSATVRRELIILKQRATVAVITGRSRADARKHLGIDPHYLVGNHGAEGLPGWEYWEEECRHLIMAWDGQLRKMLPASEDQGIVIENKGMSLSLHYRGAPDRETAHRRLLSAIAALKPLPRRISGKYVESLIPEGGPDKGTAIGKLMRQAGCARGFFVGDDVTDEAVFRLSGDDLFSVCVGHKIGSHARYYLRGQREIPLLLHRINDTLAELRR